MISYTHIHLHKKLFTCYKQFVRSLSKMSCYGVVDIADASDKASKGLFTWKEGAPANRPRATRLGGLKHSSPLHATRLSGIISGLFLERP